MNPISTESEVVTSEPEVEEEVLTALDRCDACGAQAYVQTTLKSGTLLWCAHHYNHNEIRLEPLLLRLVDERHKLLM